MQIDWQHHADRDAMADALGRRLAAATSAALLARGTAVLSLAGGSTPLPAYRAFAGHALAWEHVHVVPGDERWVPHDHPQSNFLQLRKAFAGAPAARLHPLVPADPGASPEASTATAMLGRFAGQAFDLVLLGLGEDGHIASLFPGTAALAPENTGSAAADALVVVPDPLPPDAPHPRISLSLPRLLHSRALCMAISGEHKRHVLEQAAGGGHPDSPVARLLAQGSGTLAVHWSP